MTGNKRIYIVIAAATAVIAICVILLRFYGRDTQYKSFALTELTTFVPSQDNRFLAYADGVLRYTKDGVFAYDRMGATLWAVSYNMQNPRASTNKGCTAIADIGGYAAIIIDSTGKSATITTTGRIEDVSVSGNGRMAVLTQDDMGDYIYLFDMTATSEADAIVQRHTSIDSSGFPVAFTLSSDGERLVSSYLAISDGTYVDWISFFNFGEVGANTPDDLVGYYNVAELMGSGNGVAGGIEFLTDTLVIVYCDNGFALYNFQQIQKSIGVVKIDAHTIKAVAGSDKMIVVATSDDNNRTIVTSYDSDSARELSHFTADSPFTRIFTHAANIVTYDLLAFRIYSRSGTLKMHGNFDKNVRLILPLNDTDKYLAVHDDAIALLQLSTVEESSD
jgi:hypothetical protein